MTLYIHVYSCGSSLDIACSQLLCNMKYNSKVKVYCHSSSNAIYFYSYNQLAGIALSLESGIKLVGAKRGQRSGVVSLDSLTTT